MTYLFCNEHRMISLMIRSISSIRTLKKILVGGIETASDYFSFIIIQNGTIFVNMNGKSKFSRWNDMWAVLRRGQIFISNREDIVNVRTYYYQNTPFPPVRTIYQMPPSCKCIFSYRNLHIIKNTRSSYRKCKRRYSKFFLEISQENICVGVSF